MMQPAFAKLTHFDYALPSCRQAFPALLILSKIGALVSNLSAVPVMEGTGMRFRTVCLSSAMLGAVLALSTVVPSAFSKEQGFVAEWNVEPAFDGKTKLRESISGAACAPVSPPVCLVALDEKQRTQCFTIKDRKIVPDKVMRLLPKTLDVEKLGEIDAEGAAYGDGHFYVVGSHGLSRKKGKFHPGSFFLFRVPVDATTGYPSFKFSKKTTAPEIERTDALRSLLKGAPEPIGNYAEKPLGEGAGGVNIEGLSYQNGRIFIGLRGPSVNGNAYIRSVNVDALFSDKKPDLETIEVALGEGIGVRDLAAVSDGLLLLSGPVQSYGPYGLFHLNLSSGDLTKLASLKMPDKGAKAETVLLLKETDDAYRVLLLYDGLVDGGPREYLIPHG